MRVALALLAALGVALAGCGGDEDGGGGDEAAAPATTATQGGCAVVAPPAPKADGGQSAPEGPLDADTTYRLVVDTTCGSFTITLDQARAPETAASLVSLAEAGFFDGTTFHRVVPGFVIQGGDPTGTGAGGPGYQTVDAPAQDAAYTRGVVAMAKAAHEAPGTSGSQFFVVTGEDVGLPPEYAIVGEVTEGLETVMKIDALGISDGPPSMPVVIEEVTVEES